MTGWMYYSNDGFPTAHADLAVSSRVGDSALPLYPLIRHIYEEDHDDWAEGYKPVGLRQKIVIISSDVAYIWAGSLAAAQQLDSALRYGHDSGQLEDIDYIKNTQSRLGRLDLSALILTYYNRPIIQVASINALPFFMEPFGDLFLGGSGDGCFYGVCGELVANLHPDLADEQVAQGTMSKSVSDSIVRRRLIDSKLELRMATQQFNSVATGGGVDTLIGTPEEGFSKLSDYVYAIFYEKYHGSGFQAPDILIKRSYHFGYLGYSVRNYLSMEGMSVTIPDPVSGDRAFNFLTSVHDPFSGDLSGVSCIYVRNNGSIRHHIESPEIFRSHISLNSETGRPQISDWYINDIIERDLRTPSPLRE